MKSTNILQLTQACFNKVESEVYPNKYLNSTPTKDMAKILASNQFESLYDFTHFLIQEYKSHLILNDIFIFKKAGTFSGLEFNNYYVIKPEKRETLLSFFKSVIRDQQLNQLIK